MGRFRVVSMVGTIVLGVAVLSRADDAAQIERGKALFASQGCKLCHSIEGKGNPKGPLDGIGSKVDAKEARAWLVNPKEMAAKAKAERKPPMRSFEKLPAEDLDALAAYVSSLKKT
jgi:mono/diheme cytochrome c family protein